MASATKPAAFDVGVPLGIVKIAFTPEYIKAVIDCVLRSRDKASGGVRKGLDSAINESITLDGFRYSSKAQPSQLREPMLWRVSEGDSRLIGQVLRTWAEARQELRIPVSRYLTAQEVPVEGPDLREGIFYGTWPRDEWNEAIDTVLEGNPELDRDDVRMMVCYLSGMAERLAVESEPLYECIVSLRHLPVDAPDWQDFDDFIDIVREIAESKAGSRAAVFAERCRDTLQEIQRDFADELQYLELDLAAWEQAADERPAVIDAALELAEELSEHLAEYQEIRPQAPSRKVEAERAPARADREAAIFTIAAEWERIIAEADDLSDDAASAAAAADAPADEEEETPQEAGPAAPPEEYQVLAAERERLKQERESLRTENERLRSDNEQFAKANKSLEADKQALHGENSDLKAKLSPSRDLEEYWRRYYAASAQVGSVNDAVKRAQQKFPEQLVFALNSKSDKDVPFQEPAEVFAALAWLATDYHHLRWTKPGEDPRFNERLKKSCPGWSYRPHQATTTKRQFAEWYVTEAEGRRYELVEHLGKGTSADPQKTIRIAIAWDDERGKVIVGYIGLHQKNRRTR